MNLQRLRTLARRIGLGLLLGPACAVAQTVMLYSHQDARLVRRAVALVRAFDTVRIDADISPGLAWRQAMASEIANAATVLVFWSARAQASSELAAEWRMALGAGRRVIPVVLDDTPLPAELGALQFVNWKGFERDHP